MLLGISPEPFFNKARVLVEHELLLKRFCVRHIKLTVFHQKTPKSSFEGAGVPKPNPVLLV